MISDLGNGIRFIQVGANDGIAHDPLHEHILAKGWRGILIEPLPEVFPKLVANYAGHPGLAFEQVAIHPTKTELKLMVPEGDTILASATDRHFDYWPGVDRSKLQEVRVPACRLDTIIVKHAFHPFDLLQIDAEGLDWQVMTSIDLGRFGPEYINFESWYIKEQGFFPMCLAHLRHFGYEPLPEENKMDTMVRRLTKSR